MSPDQQAALQIREVLEKGASGPVEVAEAADPTGFATIRGVFSSSFMITGLDPVEARDLALLLRAASLAAPIYKVEERTISPSLGQDNIDKGMRAVVIGFVIETQKMQQTMHQKMTEMVSKRLTLRHGLAPDDAMRQHNIAQQQRPIIGCGRSGRLVSSGWNWAATKYGCTSIGSSRTCMIGCSGWRPENRSPAAYSVIRKVRCFRLAVH